MKIKCAKCGEVNEVTLFRVYETKNKDRPRWRGRVRAYKDRLGRSSRGDVCHSCLRKRERINEGRFRRDDSPHGKVRVAVGAEKVAQRHFEGLGFSVVRTDALGPDLRCKIGDLEWTVEVKRARDVHPNTRYAGGSWVVDLVREKRKSDDLIAMVLPNGRVYIDSMRLHLAACNPSGTRTITGIVKEFGLKPMPESH